MNVPEGKPNLIRCDCCRGQVVFREALYDCELQEFVCGDCALDLNAGGWALFDAGYDGCAGKKILEMPDRQWYEGWNL